MTEELTALILPSFAYKISFFNTQASNSHGKLHFRPPRVEQTPFFAVRQVLNNGFIRLMGLLNHSCYGFIWETLSQFVKKELKSVIAEFFLSCSQNASLQS